MHLWGGGAAEQGSNTLFSSDFHADFDAKMRFSVLKHTWLVTRESSSKFTVTNRSNNARLHGKAVLGPSRPISMRKCDFMF